MKESNTIILNSEDAFAIYRLPHSEQIIIVKQDNSKINRFDELFSEKKGFAIHPFNGLIDTSIFINADNIYLNKDFSFSPNKSIQPQDISQEKYIEKANNFIDATKVEYRKLVLSRTKSIPRVESDLFPYFKQLERKYKNAMVFIVNHPKIGTWMGATPETLLSSINNSAKTIALAGTQFIDKTIKIENVKWESKEIEEQKAVMDYIETILNKNNIDYKLKGPHTKIAAKNEGGILIHLATEYKFKLKGSIFKLIHDLHPTPAVSGFPKKESIKYILKNEGYNREYYTGFLGPINIIKSDSIDLFVNLRSMKVYKNNYILYLGGGLNSKSIAIDEWNETENKAKTLEEIIKIK